MSLKAITVCIFSELAVYVGEFKIVLIRLWHIDEIYTLINYFVVFIGKAGLLWEAVSPLDTKYTYRVTFGGVWIKTACSTKTPKYPADALHLIIIN